MARTKYQRQKHLKLNEKCLYIGTRGSRECRALLAHYLGTTIPHGTNAVLAHACNHSLCSNPRHIYWATWSENVNDAFNCGAASGRRSWESLVKKHGLKKARELRGLAGKKGGQMFARKLKDGKLPSNNKFGVNQY